jgi:hypothetical protein
VTSWSTHSINNINIGKKSFDTVRSTSTIHAQRNTHTHTHTRYHTTENALQQHDDITTQESINNIAWQVQHVNSNHSQQHVTKNLWGSQYIRSHINNLYIMTSSMCNSRANFLFTWFDEVDLRHETQSVPRHCAKHITQVRTNIDMHHQQTKTKVLNKESSMSNRTKKASMVTLKITDMLNHGYEIYNVLRHYAQVSASQGDKHYHKAIFTRMLLLWRECDNGTK